jgi:hypothetical protein
MPAGYAGARSRNLDAARFSGYVIELELDVRSRGRFTATPDLGIPLITNDAELAAASAQPAALYVAVAHGHV